MDILEWFDIFYFKYFEWCKDSDITLMNMSYILDSNTFYFSTFILIQKFLLSFPAGIKLPIKSFMESRTAYKDSRDIDL